MTASAQPKLIPWTAAALGGLLLGCVPAAGCGKHGVAPLPPADLFDNSWVTAAESCWPDLANKGDITGKIERFLLVPANFRATFPSYSAQSNDQIWALLAKPVVAAPAADAGKLAYSRMPVLTRRQAAVGTSPQAALAANTQGSAPPDALCTIQTGTPVGFR